MSRQALSQPELLQLLNWELSAYDQCEGCHFTAIEDLRGDPRPECNWSGAHLEHDHALDLAEHAIVQQVLAETRRIFDLR